MVVKFFNSTHSPSWSGLGGSLRQKAAAPFAVDDGKYSSLVFRSVVDPKLFFSDPDSDPTFQEISGPDSYPT